MAKDDTCYCGGKNQNKKDESICGLRNCSLKMGRCGRPH